MTMRIVDKTKECEKKQLEKRNLIVGLYGGGGWGQSPKDPELFEF